MPAFVFALEIAAIIAVLRAYWPGGPLMKMVAHHPRESAEPAERVTPDP